MTQRKVTNVIDFFVPSMSVMKGDGHFGEARVMLFVGNSMLSNKVF